MIGMTAEVLAAQAKEAFEDIAKAVESKQCNLFLGAAVNAPPEPDSPYRYDVDKRPPMGWELAEQMVAECGYKTAYPKQDPYNLLRVAQHFEADKGRPKLVEFLTARVMTGKEPSAALRALAQLDFPVVITTNYDRLFEDALADLRPKKTPFVSVYKRQRHQKSESPAYGSPWGAPQYPIVFKMHGDIMEPESIVITDEDYIQFLVRMREPDETQPVPRRVQRSLMENPTLFVGYSLKDYNLRVLLKILRAGLDVTEFPPVFAVDRSPDALIWEFWYNRSNPRIVNFVAQDIWTFVPALYKRITTREMPV